MTHPGKPKTPPKRRTAASSAATSHATKPPPGRRSRTASRREPDLASASSPASSSSPVPEAPAGRSGERTRVQILDAAETLFSEHGLDGVSMRDIAMGAGVTLALVNYHFGSKDKLYRAVFERRIEPISQLRRAALARVMAQPGGVPPGVPPIRGVLDALARPWVEMRGHPGGQAYTRLIARETGDPAEGRRGIVADLLDPIAVEFIAAMRLALPHMSPARVAWTYHFFIGALLLILSNPDRVARLTGELCDVDRDQTVIDEIVTFSCNALLFEGNPPADAGNRRRSSGSAPATPPKKRRKTIS
jgi:AcrR family transcriptional regulator